MATIDDVTSALVSVVAAVAYPIGNPPSVLGYPVKIYAGWPAPQDLDADVVETAGSPKAAHLTVYPLPTERNVTRFQAKYEEDPLPAATYTATISGQTITIGGAAPATFFGQNIGLVIGSKGYGVATTAGQAPAQIAASLQALVVVDFPGASVSGSAITLPASARIVAARVGVSGTVRKAARTQEKQVQVIIWTSNPTSRAALSQVVDNALADTHWISMPDGSMARLKYVGSREDDFGQKARIYRRTQTFTVEYTTYAVQTASQISVEVLNLLDANNAVIVSTAA